jgi:hypothetical protein
MSQFDSYLDHYAAKLSQCYSQISIDLEAYAESVSDIDTKALVLWQASQHKLNTDPKKLRRKLYLQYWHSKRRPATKRDEALENIKDTLEGWETVEGSDDIFN